MPTVVSDSSDYEDLMEEVPAHADIRARKTYLAVAHDLLAPLQEAARRQGVSIETLANLWLREKAAEHAA